MRGSFSIFTKAFSCSVSTLWWWVSSAITKSSAYSIPFWVSSSSLRISSSPRAIFPESASCGWAAYWFSSPSSLSRRSASVRIERNFRKSETPVVAADALRFVDHRSGAIEFDGCRHDDQQRREQEDRRERCRDVEGPFPERHAENLHFGAVLHDGLVREGVVAHELQHAQEILPRHVSRNGAVHPCAQVFAAFPFGQFPRGDEHDAPARPRIEEPDIGEVGGRVALLVEDERTIRPERRQRAHRRADVPHDVHPAFDHFREAGRVAAFAF